jgi:hypothetical protein
VSPLIPIVSTTAKLTFRNNYSLEASSSSSAGFDGGVLDIKIGGGVFQDILAAGGSFASGGYTRTISSSYGNPFSGRQAWSGSSAGWIATQVNLPVSAAGQNIQLRWPCGTDNSIRSTGWYIDTISISDAVCCVSITMPSITSAFILPAAPNTLSNLTVVVNGFNDASSSPVSLGYQWQESATNLVGQTGSSLPHTATFAGGSYRVVITPSNGGGTGPAYTTASVNVPVDSDSNGIDDDWEVRYFGTLGIDPNADADGDGPSNLAEFLTGADPTGGTSAFRIRSIAHEDNDVRVAWTTGVGKTNALQATTGYSFANNFAAELFVVTNTTGSVTNYLDAGAATNSPARFYRIRLAL